MRKPFKVKTVQQTCEVAPSQWEGRTEDRRPIYARYRFGHLKVSIGKPGGTIDDAVRSGTRIVDRDIGHPLDGLMAYKDLKRYTKGIVHWPKKQIRKSLLGGIQWQQLEKLAAQAPAKSAKDSTASLRYLKRHLGLHRKR